MPPFRAFSIRPLWLLRIWLGVLSAAAQPSTTPAGCTPESFGYRHIVTQFGRDSVDILVLSAPGEAQVRKPVLLWAQGSLPVPLVLSQVN